MEELRFGIDITDGSAISECIIDGESQGFAVRLYEKGEGPDGLTGYDFLGDEFLKRINWIESDRLDVAERERHESFWGKAAD